MYCSQCGTSLPEGASFCPECGAPTHMRAAGAQGAGSENTAGAAGGNAGGQSYGQNAGAAGGQGAGTTGDQTYGRSTSSGQDVFDQQIDDIGDGIKDAARNVRDGFKNADSYWEDTKEEFHQSSKEFKENLHGAGQAAGDAADHIKKNWRDYLTRENLEKLVAFGPILPLFETLAMIPIGILIGIIVMIPLVGLFIGSALTIIVGLLFLVLEILSIVGGIYLVATDETKRTPWGWVAVAASAMVLIEILLTMAKVPFVGTILSIAAMIYSVILTGHVAFRGLGIETPLEPGKDIHAYKEFYDGCKANEDNEVLDPNAPQSYFDGSGLTLFGLTLLTILVSAITCGIATPWMLCKLFKWRKTHTVIDGRRLDFDGSGGSLLGHWILWEILSIITCGIYSFFMFVAVRKWEMRHTFYQDTQRTVAEGTGSLFDGNSFQYFGYGLLQLLLLIVTCGLAWPWTGNMIRKWQARHEVVCGDRMGYDGTALGLLVQYIVVFLLSIITCGIYSSWGTVRLYKYIYKHYHVTDVSDVQ